MLLCQTTFACKLIQKNIENNKQTCIVEALRIDVLYSTANWKHTTTRSNLRRHGARPHREPRWLKKEHRHGEGRSLARRTVSDGLSPGDLSLARSS